MDDYVEAFVRDGEDQVTELNNALLALESDPSDGAAMDRIFRTAHTLKGNFGAMGFEEASGLAHAIEDLLDAMRQGEIAVTPERMDHVFAGVDEVEACLDEIADRGETNRDVEWIVEDLRGVLEACRDTRLETTVPEGPSGGDGERDQTTGDGERDQMTGDGERDQMTGDGERDQTTPIHHFDVTALGDTTAPVYAVAVDPGETEMPGVDAMFVIEEIEASYDVLDTHPSREAIEDGQYEDDFELAIATAEADIEETIGSIGRVAEVAVREITDGIQDAGGPSAVSAGKSSTLDDAAEGSVPRVASGEESDGRTDDSASVAGTDTGPDSEGSPAAGETSRGTSTGGIQSVRVDVDRLDELHGLVEQLVTTRITLRRGVDPENRRVEAELDELDTISASLQDTVMDMRLVPMKKIVGKFPRLVRDLAREEGKQVEFTIEGDDVELDRTILTEISDPLMHLLRNAVDHGIEAPAQREAAGKDPTGEITLRADRERDRVRVEVVDDGAGIDPDRLRRKAVEKGVRTRAEVDDLEDDDVPELIFAPGFSTTEEVTDVSGRGVGMDVVRDTVTGLDGQVEIESTPGEGTRIVLSLPVTVAIVTVLFVESGEEEYGIPIKSVDEIGRMRPVKQVDGAEVVTYGDEIYPLVRLSEALDVPGGHSNGEGMLVKVRESERKIAIHCDEVRGQEEVVVKPFDGILSGIPGLGGAAVLGEGAVVTILDVATL